MDAASSVQMVSRQAALNLDGKENGQFLFSPYFS